jgi:hypothetical protein
LPHHQLDAIVPSTYRKHFEIVDIAIHPANGYFSAIRSGIIPEIIGWKFHDPDQDSESFEPSPLNQKASACPPRPGVAEIRLISTQLPLCTVKPHGGGDGAWDSARTPRQARPEAGADNG